MHVSMHFLHSISAHFPPPIDVMVNGLVTSLEQTKRPSMLLALLEQVSSVHVRVIVLIVCVDSRTQLFLGGHHLLPVHLQLLEERVLLREEGGRGEDGGGGGEGVSERAKRSD